MQGWWQRLLPLVGILISLGAWYIVSAVGTTQAIPSPQDVAAEFLGDHQPIYVVAAVVTLREASVGFVIGFLISAVLSVICIFVPRLGRFFTRLTAAAAAIPIIALGPVLITILPRDFVPIAVACIFTTMTIFLACLTGLQSVNRAADDYFSVAGAKLFTRLWRLQIPSAGPAVLNGLRVASPIAILGAIVGEWFGARVGIGALLVTSLQNYNVNRLWAAALAGAAFSIIAYSALGALEHRARGRIS